VKVSLVLVDFTMELLDLLDSNQLSGLDLGLLNFMEWRFRNVPS
jgi:hypothetical protein